MAAEMTDACMHVVQRNEAILLAARNYLGGIGTNTAVLTELRVEDLVHGGEYSLVIVGKLNTPVMEALVFRKHVPNDCRHARFGAPQKYLDPSAAVAASGLSPKLVDSCRLIRVLAPPWGSDYTPLWEIKAGDAKRVVDQTGKSVNGTIESLLRSSRGGAGESAPNQ